MASNQKDCLIINSTCRWLGGISSCKYANSDCIYRVGSEEAACQTLKDISGFACTNGASSSGKCALTCASKIDATSQADCLAVKSTCRWLGGTSACVDENSTCTYTVIGDIASVCKTLTDNAGNTCVADSG